MGPPSRKEGIVTGQAIHPEYARLVAFGGGFRPAPSPGKRPLADLDGISTLGGNKRFKLDLFSSVEHGYSVKIDVEAA
jgi:hypothetical protein